MATPFSFGASGKPQMSNPNGLTPDGTGVGRVNRRDQRGDSGIMEALIKIFGEMLGRPKVNNTPENLAALRNDPIGDRNKQDWLDAVKVDNQFVPGYGSALGPATRASGMTAEQVAQMQGPTAANQWKFPHLFRLPKMAPEPKPNDWVMPGNLGPNTVIPQTKPQPTPEQIAAADEAMRFQGDPNFFNMPKQKQMPKSKVGFSFPKQRSIF